MIYVNDLIQTLKKNKISFFTGVPDSILKEFTKSFDKPNNLKHVTAVNEGSAVSIGIGYHLSTQKIPCIYMQNSGLGNAINPLISIAHKNVYSIPLLLMIGWRGSPNQKDEPQHKTKGKITEKKIDQSLYTNNVPDPDFLIRTGNTARLSNFLLWQLAYSEIFFEKKLWPDFNKNDYLRIINKFKKIKRNFGNV